MSFIGDDVKSSKTYYYRDLNFIDSPEEFGKLFGTKPNSISECPTNSNSHNNYENPKELNREYSDIWETDVLLHTLRQYLMGSNNKYL